MGESCLLRVLHSILYKLTSLMHLERKDSRNILIASEDLGTELYKSC